MKRIEVDGTHLPVVYSNRLSGSINCIFFEDTKQLDRLIGILQDAKANFIKEQQKKFDEKHQLSLNFSE